MSTALSVLLSRSPKRTVGGEETGSDGESMKRMREAHRRTGRERHTDQQDERRRQTDVEDAEDRRATKGWSRERRLTNRQSVRKRKCVCGSSYG